MRNHLTSIRYVIAVAMIVISTPSLAQDAPRIAPGSGYPANVSQGDREHWQRATHWHPRLTCRYRCRAERNR